MILHSFCRQYDECTDGGKCGDFHALLLSEIQADAGAIQTTVTPRSA
jgi:hypothetical protein